MSATETPCPALLWPHCLVTVWWVHPVLQNLGLAVPSGPDHRLCSQVVGTAPSVTSFKHTFSGGPVYHPRNPPPTSDPLISLYLVPDYLVRVLPSASPPPHWIISFTETGISDS